MNNQYIPVICQEECAEVIQSLSKIIRFGIDQVNPNNGVSNKYHLTEEIGQLRHMLQEVIKLYDLDMDEIRRHQAAKQEANLRWDKYHLKQSNHNLYAEQEWLRKSTGLLHDTPT